jgi:hypothetical protein
MATRLNDGSTIESTRIGAGNPQYQAVLNRRFNKRFNARRCATALVPRGGRS